jgi:predicted MPP superfamily phosphohydrolase
VILVLIIFEIYRELHTFKETNVEINSEKLKGLYSDKKIVFLSDLHNQVYGTHNVDLIRAVRDARPDLILIGGDFLVGKQGVSYRPAIRLVRQLVKIAPVYYANGNHEQRMKEKPKKYNSPLYVSYKNDLLNLGVHLLENRRELLPLDDVWMTISGYEISLRHYGMKAKTTLKTEDLYDKVGNPSGDFNILLAHNPTFMETYFDWGADLVLSGHLHGGIVRLPFIGGVIAPGFIFNPKYDAGIFTSSDATVEKNTSRYVVNASKDSAIGFVTRGIGAHTIKIRLFNPAELVTIVLKANDRNYEDMVGDEYINALNNDEI